MLFLFCRPKVGALPVVNLIFSGFFSFFFLIQSHVLFADKYYDLWSALRDTVAQEDLSELEQVIQDQTYNYDIGDFLLLLRAEDFLKFSDNQMQMLFKYADIEKAQDFLRRERLHPLEVDREGMSDQSKSLFLSVFGSLLYGSVLNVLDMASGSYNESRPILFSFIAETLVPLLRLAKDLEFVADPVTSQLIARLTKALTRRVKGPEIKKIDFLDNIGEWASLLFYVTHLHDWQTGTGKPQPRLPEYLELDMSRGEALRIFSMYIKKKWVSLDDDKNGVPLREVFFGLTAHEANEYLLSVLEKMKKSRHLKPLFVPKSYHSKKYLFPSGKPGRYFPPKMPFHFSFEQRQGAEDPIVEVNGRQIVFVVPQRFSVEAVPLLVDYFIRGKTDLFIKDYFILMYKSKAGPTKRILMTPSTVIDIADIDLKSNALIFNASDWLYLDGSAKSARRAIYSFKLSDHKEFVEYLNAPEHTRRPFKDFLREVLLATHTSGKVFYEDPSKTDFYNRCFEVFTTNASR